MAHRFPQMKLPLRKTTMTHHQQQSWSKEHLKERNMLRLEQDVPNGAGLRDEEPSQMLHLNFSKQNSQMKANTFPLLATKDRTSQDVN